MRVQTLRRFATGAAALAIIAFCSCERHSADELHGHVKGHGGEAHGEESEHMKSHASKEEAPHDKAHGKQGPGDQQQMSTTALTPTPSPTPHH